MKPTMRTKRIYWVVTLLFVIIMLMSATMMLAGAKPYVDGMIHLGYPVYICMILGVAKLLGGIAILQNRFSMLKEWAYAGYTFTLAGAVTSHAFAGDPFAKIITPVIMLSMVFVSYILWKNALSIPMQQTSVQNNQTSIA